MHRSTGIVADGYWRARAAVEPAIRAAVTAEYAERLTQAGVWTWFLVRWQRSAEIRRRVNKQAPRQACY